jgi:hypothetical protein
MYAKVLLDNDFLVEKINTLQAMLTKEIERSKVLESAVKGFIEVIPLSSKEGRPDYGTMVTSDKIKELRDALHKSRIGLSDRVPIWGNPGDKAIDVEKMRMTVELTALRELKTAVKNARELGKYGFDCTGGSLENTVLWSRLIEVYAEVDKLWE